MDMGNQKGAELEVQNSKGTGIGGSPLFRSSERSSVTRGACWYRGYKALGIMLLWLVVRAEVSPDGATTLAGAAVDATAAGVGEAVNYWAAMEDETTGDLRVDVWAAQDTDVEDGGSPGQAVLWSAGNLQQRVSSGWGRRKMGWTHQQGHKVGRGLRRGGTLSL